MNDLALAAATVAMSLGLLPTILGSHKPALATAAVNAGGCTLCAGVNLRLRLRLAAAVLAVAALGWLILTIQTA